MFIKETTPAKDTTVVLRLRSGMIWPGCTGMTRA
jgi:hypothetical protein